LGGRWAGQPQRRVCGHRRTILQTEWATLRLLGGTDAGRWRQAVAFRPVHRRELSFAQFCGSGKAGGNAEASASWAGNILRTSGGHTLSLVVVGGLAADNIDASAGVRNMKDSAEGQLTLVSGQDQLVRGRYVISHEKSGEEPDPSRMKTNHVASIESAFPGEAWGELC